MKLPSLGCLGLLVVMSADLRAGISIQGSVQSGGRPIPAATVTAVLSDRRISSLTDGDGHYQLKDLEPGTWLVEVRTFGFSKAAKEVLIGPAATPVDCSFELKVKASVSAEASVPPAAPPPPQPDLPAENSLAPGLPSEDDAGANAPFLVNGSLSRGLQVSRDANADADAESGKPKKKSKTSGKSAAAGFPGGGAGDAAALQVGKVDRGRRKITAKRSRANSFGNRSGGALSDIHGAAYWTHSFSAWNARPFALTGQESAKPDLGQRRFDLSAGGPLYIPRLVSGEGTFFFVSYSQASGRNPYSSVARMPTPAERGGDFSQSGTPGPVALYDPTTRLPLAGGRLPASRIDATAAGLLSFMPLPNLPGPVQNYQIVTSVPGDTRGVGVRIDHNLSRTDRLAFSFNRQGRDSESAQLYGFRDSVEGRGFSSNLGWTHSLGSQGVLQAKLSFRRTWNRTLPFFAYKTDVAESLGIGGASPDAANYGPPSLKFTNFGNLLDGNYLLRRDQSIAMTVGLNRVRRSHAFNVGGGLRRLQYNSRTDQNGRGSFSFGGLATSAFDAAGFPASGTGFDFADFLLGMPNSSSIRYGSANNYFRGFDWNAFVQDDWRARPNLTLSLGLRYEYFAPLTEKFGRMANLDIQPGFTGVAVATPGADAPYSGRFPAALIDSDRNNFSPRVGLAWKPSRGSHTQVRAGYGWYYNGSIYNQFAPLLASQPPFAVAASQATSLGRWLTLRNGLIPNSWARTTNTYAVDRGYRVGYAQTWNLAVQRDLPHSLVIEAGYLGTKGTRLDVERRPNRAPRGSPLTAEQRLVIGNAVGFTYDSSDGNSTFHAGQLRLTRRLTRGISANMLYTFSRSIDNSSTFGGVGNVVAQNDKDLRAERGLSSFDRRHALALTFELSSPIGDRGSAWIPVHGMAGRVLKSWALEGSLTAQSGLPFTARVLGNRSDPGGTGVIGSGRADSTGAPVEAADWYFNPGAFSAPEPGQFGNAGRNTIPGPGLFALNLTLGRSFRMGERLRLRVRIETTNLTNHAGIIGLGTVVNASDYALPLAAAPMRTVSLAMRFRF